MGHAARSLPLIEQLLQEGVAVIMASHGRAGLLLRRSFPEVPYVECPPYQVHYRGRSFYLAIFRQLPGIFRAAFLEHRWLRRFVRETRVDAVISDSRFGCFHPTLRSVLLTHQLRLPLQPSWLACLVNGIYQWHLRRFDEIWVPDLPNGLSGTLSFPSPLARTRYLGHLSRFRAEQVTQQYDLLVLLSGPEPQRTYLENILLRQLENIGDLRILFVQGRTELEARTMVNAQLEVVSYLAGPALQRALASAAVVLCRSGYSSLMDLAAGGKRAILVPTPGQPEQEYLAERCQEMGWAIVQRQDQIDIERALRASQREKRQFPNPGIEPNDRLTVLLKEFLTGIS